MTAQEGLSHDATVPHGQQLQERIGQLIHDRLHIDIEDPSVDLFETGIIDSLGLVELLLGLEAEFGIRTITEDLDIDNFRSLERTTAYVMKHSSAQEPPNP